ncbi:Endoplasmic reticulum mannosyl-oligosaccharide 1,2-alpha-mannosidase [Strongyloides ratti]|uniref:alpha-1,2-Mannosidase n=1 Tax=Strongyloides ratti TaxID=34506 RepID=A0A090LLR3_STRRB|nr:Endoplasmic reticulum mannosyl-oligosaccharide 1,2-alpha-mannosidase [Strongyloides ratti]CEF70661.1 Endoplasmic reticulum mannosyl-oligosaccharide 1,2-alpha-mannosidase [Strongyloides ratti]
MENRIGMTSSILSFGQNEQLPFIIRQKSVTSKYSITKHIRMWRSLHKFQKFFFILMIFGIIYFIGSLFLQKENISNNIIEKKDDNDSAGIDFEDDNNNIVINSKMADELNKRIVFEEPTNEKQKAVREGFKHAWKNYKKYAWGADHLRPISRKSSDWMSLGLTIVDSLDTLLIMNLVEEYNEGREWVKGNLTFENDKFVNFFETSIRVLGGLLSTYHLTGDVLYKKKASILGERLLGAIESSKSGIPYSDVNLKTKESKNPSWSLASSLSEVTSVQLEFRDLGKVTGNKTFENLTFNINNIIHEDGCKEMEGLCPMFIDPITGKFIKDSSITLGARTDSYYEYLLKQWIQTAMESVKKHLIRYSVPNKFLYIGEITSTGTLALGYKNGLPKEYLDIGIKLGETCHLFYKNPTGLGPEIAHFNKENEDKEDLYIKPLDSHSLLRPEAVEGWFYLYRFTGDKKYQDWAWDMFKAIEKYAKLETGYSSIVNVKKIPVSYKDMMESFFLSETMKYLYLILSDDQTVLSLDKWVFNTEGHPLPIYKN